MLRRAEKWTDCAKGWSAMIASRGNLPIGSSQHSIARCGCMSIADRASMKLHTKQREGSKVHRTYDQAQTPMQRLLASDAVPPNKQQELLRVTQALDPLRLLAESSLPACGQARSRIPEPGRLFHAPVFCQAGDFGTGSCRWHSWHCPLAAQKGAQKKVSKKWAAP